MKDMREEEFQQTLESLIKDISSNDLDRLIIQLQFMRAKRKRDFESTVMFGFCDNCLKSFPAKYGECTQCHKPLRILPIRAEYNYLLDGEPKDGNNRFVTIKE